MSSSELCAIWKHYRLLTELSSRQEKRATRRNGEVCDDIKSLRLDDYRSSAFCSRALSLPRFTTRHSLKFRGEERRQRKKKTRIDFPHLIAKSTRRRRGSFVCANERNNYCPWRRNKEFLSQFMSMLAKIKLHRRLRDRHNKGTVKVSWLS